MHVSWPNFSVFFRGKSEPWSLGNEQTSCDYIVTCTRIGPWCRFFFGRAGRAGPARAPKAKKLFSVRKSSGSYFAPVRRRLMPRRRSRLFFSLTASFSPHETNALRRMYVTPLTGGAVRIRSVHANLSTFLLSASPTADRHLKNPHHRTAQFITLAGFHSDGLIVSRLAKEYGK